MGIQELKRFGNFCKLLEVNDITKAEKLIERAQFADITKYMIENNCKLEQEIFSWKLFR